MRRFPFADPGTWRETSPHTDDYNCAAWVVGVVDAKWWPEPEALEYHWPPTALRDGTLEAFIDGYRTLGFTPCDDGELEA